MAGSHDLVVMNMFVTTKRALPAQKTGNSSLAPRNTSGEKAWGEEFVDVALDHRPFARSLQDSSSPRPSPPPCGREGEISSALSLAEYAKTGSETAFSGSGKPLHYEHDKSTRGDHRGDHARACHSAMDST